MKTTPRFDPSKIRILCVDGEEDRLKKVAGELANRGFAVDSSRTHKESLELIESHSHHAVVVDCAMLTGEIATALYRKSVSSRNGTVKIILGPFDGNPDVNPLDILATDCLHRDEEGAYIARIAGTIRDKAGRGHAKASAEVKDIWKPPETNLLEVTAHAGICVWELDENGTCTYVSASVKDLFGFAVNDVIGKPFLDFVNEGDDSAKAIIGHITKREPFTNLRVSIVKPDGADAILEVSALPVTGPDKTFCGFKGICRDVTEKTMDELAWSTTTLLLDIFLNPTPVEAIYKKIPPILSERFGFPSSSVELYDERSQEMVFMGLHPENTGGAEPLRVPVGDTLSGVAILSGEPLVETRAQEREEYRSEALKKLGTQTFVCVPIRTREHVFGVVCLGDTRSRKVPGKLVEALQIVAGHLAQIIERKTAEDALARSESKYRALTEQADDGIFMADSNARYLEANPAGQKLLGYSLEELRGMTIKDVIPPDELKKNPLKFAEIMSGKTVTDTCNLRRKDGSLVPTEITAKLVSDGRIMAFARDITERLKAEKLIADVARFPEQNPFPIIRIGADGVITYANKTSALVLDAWGVAVGQKAPGVVIDNCVSALHSRILHEIEVDCGGRIFSLVLSSVPEEGYVNVYGREITDWKKAENTLRDERNFITTVLNNVGALVMVTDRNGRIAQFNRACERVSGFSFEDAKGKMFIPLLVAKEDANGARDAFTTLLSGKDSIENESRWVTRRGEQRLIRWSFSRLRNAEGETIFVVAAGMDITESRKAENELQLAAKVYESAMDGIIVTNADGFILSVNPAFTRITGFTPVEAVGKTPAILKSGHHDADFYKDMWEKLRRKGYWRGEMWNRRKNGETYPQWMTVSGVTDDRGKIVQYVTVFQDITDIKRYQEEITYHAYHDPLTGLPNRLLFDDRLRHAIARAKRDHKKAAVLYIDLDGFKEINDAHGHNVGDMVLRGVAVRLAASLRDEDTVSRLGGDEFIILLENTGHKRGVRLVAEKILSAVREPFSLKGREISVGASLGVAMFPSEVDDPETLIKSADAAMYGAKALGKNQFMFFGDLKET